MVAENEPHLSYKSEPRPHILITWDSENLSYGYISPESEEFAELRFQDMVIDVAEQYEMQPLELLQRLMEGEIFSFEPSKPIT